MNSCGEQRMAANNGVKQIMGAHSVLVPILSIKNAQTNVKIKNERHIFDE
jgi:hypothetical protein